MSKVFLCGYNEAAVHVLTHLVTRGDVSDVAVFTHRPSGSIPSLSQKASELGVWWTYESVNHTGGWPFQPDVISSVYYRDIIHGEVIAAANGKAFNCHPSLLPKHRGCSSLTWALFEGDQSAGISYHYMVERVDKGKLLLQAAFAISPEDTQATLYERAMKLAAEYWPAAFSLVTAGFAGVDQIGTGSFHRRGVPNDGLIDPNWDRVTIERFIRAMTYPPFPYAKWNGVEVRSMAEFDALAGTATSK